MNSPEQLVLYYQLLRQHGLNDSHSGNGSIRDSHGFTVTKTGACADTIQTNELISCSMHNALPPNVSLDAAIHRATYQTLDTCHSVLHAHNPYTIALTLKSDTFKPVDFEGRLYFGDLCVIECEEDHYLDVMPARISKCLKQQPVAIVQSHGVYAAADNIELAYKWLCSLEQSAKIKWLALQV